MVQNSRGTEDLLKSSHPVLKSPRFSTQSNQYDQFLFFLPEIMYTYVSNYM